MRMRQEPMNQTAHTAMLPLFCPSPSILHIQAGTFSRDSIRPNSRLHACKRPLFFASLPYSPAGRSPRAPAEQTPEPIPADVDDDLEMPGWNVEPPPAQWFQEPRDANAPGASLRAAMASIFSKEESPANVMSRVLRTNCTWDMPLFRVTSREAIVDQVDSFLNFILDPVVLFTRYEEESDCDSASNRVVLLEWLLSGTYPLPWRPRVTVSGQTRAEYDEADLITSIVDKWDVSPSAIITQVLPRITDLIHFYPLPHAETDDCTQRLLHKAKEYKIVRMAARPELRVRAVVVAKPILPYIWVAPALPESAYVGTLRRKEEIAAVSPVSVRHFDDEDSNLFEWALPVPGSMFGNCKVPPPPHTSHIAHFVDTPARRCAVIRYGGLAMEPLFETKLAELTDYLKRDGFIGADEEVKRSRVWARQFDIKFGFNSKSRLAIASYASGRIFPPRINEIVIELPMV